MLSNCNSRHCSFDSRLHWNSLIRKYLRSLLLRCFPIRSLKESTSFSFPNPIPSLLRHDCLVESSPNSSYLGHFVFPSMATIQLFQKANYQGISNTFSTSVEKLSSYGLDNKVSSAKVFSDIWICFKDEKFWGSSTVLLPANYSNSDKIGLDNDSMSSCRRIQSDSSPLAYVFEGTDFRGASAKLTGNVRDFSEIGFNDKTSSIIVVSGTWKFSSRKNFLETKWTLLPGFYSAPADVFKDNAISSAQFV